MRGAVRPVPLSLRKVEDLFHERGVEISHVAVRFRRHRFGPMFAFEIRIHAALKAKLRL